MVSQNVFLIILLAFDKSSYYYITELSTLCSCCLEAFVKMPCHRQAMEVFCLWWCVRLENVSKVKWSAHTLCQACCNQSPPFSSPSSPRPSRDGLSSAETPGSKRKMYSAVPGRHYVVVKSYQPQAEGEITLYKNDRVKGNASSTPSQPTLTAWS